MTLGTRRATKPRPICLSTLNCFTTGVVATPRWLARARLPLTMPGSCNKNWRHEPAPKVSEKQREPQYEPCASFSAREWLLSLESRVLVAYQLRLDAPEHDERAG